MHWKEAIPTLLTTLVGQPRLGLITDVDGTISPIVSDPDAAQVTTRCRDVLGALVPQITLVAAISGRAVADVRDRVGLPGMVYIGNHGLEWWAAGTIQLAPGAAAARSALEAALNEARHHLVPGVSIEDKGVTASIHYRQAADPPSAAAALLPELRRIAAAHHLRLFQGRMVFELRPPIDINKGSALLRLVSEHRLEGALYLGDDTTDIDALRAARQLRHDGTCFALGVGVESSGTPTALRENADLMAFGIQDVESLLTWLLNARMASSS